MKTPLIYGALLAIGTAILTLLLFFAGLHDSPAAMQTASWIGLPGSAAISITALAFAMREKRADPLPSGTWGYGSAVGVGMLTALVGVLLGGIFNYLYFSIINPRAVDTLLQSQLYAMEAKGMSAAQMDQAEPMMRRWMTPGLITLAQAFTGFISLIVLTLLVAIFYRQRPAEADKPMTT